MERKMIATKEIVKDVYNNKRNVGSTEEYAVVDAEAYTQVIVGSEYEYAPVDIFDEELSSKSEESDSSILPNYLQSYLNGVEAKDSSKAPVVTSPKVKTYEEIPAASSLKKRYKDFRKASPEGSLVQNSKSGSDNAKSSLRPRDDEQIPQPSVSSANRSLPGNCAISDPPRSCPPICSEEQGQESGTGEDDQTSLLTQEQMAERMKCYRMRNSDKYLVHLKCGTVMAPLGKLRLTLISGGIEIYGFVLNGGESQRKTVDVYATMYYARPTLTAIMPTSPVSRCDIETRVRDIDECDAKKLVAEFRDEDTLLVAERLATNFASLVGLFVDSDVFGEKSSSGSSRPEARALRCFLHDDSRDARSTFRKHETWDAIELKKVNVICGGSNVGKSTMSRYLANRSLSAGKTVLYVDLDPGQTEFTAPGCVSAVVVADPLLGNGFTHAANPEKMVFVGEVNVSLCPFRYVKSVEWLVESCRSESAFADLPWIVNTMGFSKGLGVDIMINVLKLLKPDVVIELLSPHFANNYPFRLVQERVRSEPAILVPVQNSDLNYVYYNAISQGSKHGLRAFEWRDMMTLAYFSQIVSFPYYSFNAVQPRWKRFSGLYLSVLDSLISPRDILRAFNASLVALCRLDEDAFEDVLEVDGREEDYFKIALKPAVVPCSALGIVRGINCQEKRIYILTHLSDEELASVNCLCIGKICLPLCVYVNQFFVDRPTVYTNVSASGHVKSVKRVFRHVFAEKSNEE